MFSGSEAFCFMAHLILPDQKSIRFPKGKPFPLTPHLIARFWDKIDKPSLLECWPWTAARNDYGYGVFCVAGFGTFYAHRLVYVFQHGPIERGMMVCHSCDFPSCCNPWHLSLGTQSYNVNESVKRGRHSSLGPRSVIDQSTEAEIAEQYLSGAPRRLIAERYGVSARVVYRIGCALASKGAS